MAHNSADREFLAFVSKLTELLSSYSSKDLRLFHRLARRGFPSILPVVEACIQVAESRRARTWKTPTKSEIVQGLDRSEGLHLFDLLRSKKLFPTNSGLADFAARVVPKMTRKRFDKMSRSDIAARIIDYLETLDSNKRRNLEVAMRKAIASISAGMKEEPQSFFSQWERIIKGIER